MEEVEEEDDDDDDDDDAEDGEGDEDQMGEFHEETVPKVTNGGRRRAAVSAECVPARPCMPVCLCAPAPLCLCSSALYAELCTKGQY